MSFSSVGSLGSASAKAAGQTLTMSPSSAVPAGHLIWVCVAWLGDRGYSDGAGRMDTGIACTDDAGNIYTQLQSGLYDISDSMFLTYVDNPLTTSSVITITHRSNLLVAKAVSAWEFTIGAGKRFAVWRDGVNAAEPMGLTTYNMTVSPGVSQEYLFLQCHAAQAPTSDSYTYDTDYTPITAAGTTGGLATSNVSLRGQFRIFTGTTDTVTITDNTAAWADCWNGFIAVSEIDYDDNFPTFPNFDQFNRADEEPLVTPPWSSSTTDLPGQGTRRVAVKSNQAAAGAVGTFHGSQWWATPIPAGDDGEVFATLAVAGSGGLLCFGSGSGQDATLSSYAVYWIPMSDARPDMLQWGESGNAGSIGSRWILAWVNQANGYKFGIQMRQSGAVMHLWADVGSGWRWVSCYYKTVFIQNGGKFGLNFQNDFVTRIDDFGGGTSLPVVMGQIIRRLP